MAKSSKSTSKKKTKKARKLPQSLSWLGQTKPIMIGLFVLSVLLYANTFGHEYAQDDAIVVTDNMFTTEGVAGIPGIYQYDTFFGFFKVEGKAKLVSGGRYRPFTLMMFAIEYELFGDSPQVMHVFNALWYGLTVMVLYQLLLLLFQSRGRFDKNLSTTAIYFVPLAAALLFAVHPLHTEAVANIKGRDEILTLLGSLAALYFLMRGLKEKEQANVWPALTVLFLSLGFITNLFVIPLAVTVLIWIRRRKDSGNWLWSVLSGVCFFLALLSKENAITFLGIAPLALYYFSEEKIPGIVHRMLPMIVAAVVFLLIRGAILGWDFGQPSQELMNNPFLKLENGQYVDFSAGEKSATIMYTLGKYVQLALAPYPLTHDYYPRAVDIMSWGNWRVLLSLLLYMGLLFWAIWGLRKRELTSFGVWFFLLTLSIVSNIVFPVGTNMSERFLFMPSVGVVLVVALLLARLSKQLRWGAVAVLVIAYAGITVARNPVWQNNYTLFTADIYKSPNSAKLRNAMGGELTSQWAKLPPAQREQQKNMLQEAVGHLDEAIRIHPTYKQAYYIKGNALNYLQQYDASIQAYQQALNIDPGYDLAFQNQMITYRDAGKFFGEQQGDIAKATRYLEQAYAGNPDDYETVRLLGVAYGNSGNNAKAIEFFRRGTELAPNNARAWFDLGFAYQVGQQPAEAEAAMRKARELDPEIEQKVRGGG